MNPFPNSESPLCPSGVPVFTPSPFAFSEEEKLQLSQEFALFRDLYDYVEEQSHLLFDPTASSFAAAVAPTLKLKRAYNTLLEQHPAYWRLRSRVQNEAFRRFAVKKIETACMFCADVSWSLDEVLPLLDTDPWEAMARVRDRYDPAFVEGWISEVWEELGVRLYSDSDLNPGREVFF